MKIKFGSIIVKGSGKIGGHMVRNFRGQPLLTRLALPTKSARFLSNPQKSRMQQAIKIWNDLSKAERDQWDTVAGTIPFVNLFGDTYYYSGRGLVVYISINCQIGSYNFPDVFQFDSTISTHTCNGIEIDFGKSDVNLIDYEQFGNGRAVIAMNQSINESRNYLEKDLKFIGSIGLTGIDPNVLWQFITEMYGQLNYKYTYTIGIKIISPFGMASKYSVYKAVNVL